MPRMLLLIAGQDPGAEELRRIPVAMLAAREYKYVSPVIVWGARDKGTGEPQGTTLTSMAITNSPLMEKLPAIAFSEAGWQIECAPALSAGDRGGKDNVKPMANETKEMLERIDAQLDSMTRARMAGTDLQYHQALKLVASENRELDRRHTALQRSLATNDD